jgi:hypothetical protein
MEGLMISSKNQSFNFGVVSQNGISWAMFANSSFFELFEYLLTCGCFDDEWLYTKLSCHKMIKVFKSTTCVLIMQVHILT